jgi:hypothetical protein
VGDGTAGAGAIATCGMGGVGVAGPTLLVNLGAKGAIVFMLGVGVVGAVVPVGCGVTELPMFVSMLGAIAAKPPFCPTVFGVVGRNVVLA